MPQAHTIRQLQTRRPGYPFRRIFLYTVTVLRELGWSLAGLAFILAIGAAVYATSPDPQTLRPPSLLNSLYLSWMALLGQTYQLPPANWRLAIVTAIFPFIGLVLIGERIVRLSLLLLSRKDRQKEWMRIMAATNTDHVVLCGLGHLGFRVLEQLLAAGVDVVAIEKEEDNRFVASAKALGVPVLIRDMKDDDALIEAGVQRARVIIVGTNDDLANLEVALDARRMNPHIRVAMRLYDQQIAGKIAGAFDIDAAFSSSALAAPAVAALAMHVPIVSAFRIGEVPHVVLSLNVNAGNPLAGPDSLATVESRFGAKLLGRTSAEGGGPGPGPGVTLTVCVPSDKAAALIAAASSRSAAGPATAGR